MQSTCTFFKSSSLLSKFQITSGFLSSNFNVATFNFLLSGTESKSIRISNLQVYFISFYIVFFFGVLALRFTVPKSLNQVPVILNGHEGKMPIAIFSDSSRSQFRVQ